MTWNFRRPGVAMTAAALILGGFTFEAAACRMTAAEPRSHALLHPDFSAGFVPPHDTVLRPGDLVSVPQWAGASYRVVLANGQVASADDNVPNLVPLSEERFQALADGSQPRPVRIVADDPAAGQPLGYLRYGASGPGTFWLVGQREQQTWVERVSVVPRPVQRSGADVVVDAVKTAAASQPVYLSYEDRLIIELPGSVADGWEVRVSEDKFTVVRMEPAAAGRWRLHLERRPSTYPTGKFEVTVGTSLLNRQRLQFMLRPIPAC